MALPSPHRDYAEEAQQAQPAPVARRVNNEEVSWSWCQYASGPWNGKFVVQRIVKSDYCAFLTQAEAQRFIREQESR